MNQSMREKRMKETFHLEGEKMKIERRSERENKREEKG